MYLLVLYAGMEEEKHDEEIDGDLSEESDGEKAEEETKPDEIYRRVAKYKKSEMIDRLYFYETVWETLDETTRFFLNNIGNMIGITARNYGYRVGVLLGMVFDAKVIRFATKEKIYDSALGAYVFDTKVSSVFFNNLLSYDIISKREIEEMVEVEEDDERTTPG